MANRFKILKQVCGTILAVAILCFAVVGIQTTWVGYVARDYDKHLTEQVYVDATVNQNVNLVFYKRGCPYCEAGKKAVINASEKSSYPTFYIDVESESGQALVKKYQVRKAATILQIRGSKVEMFSYAVKNKSGTFTSNTAAIKEAFND